MFIVIEGPDGAGKTTLAKSLATALQNKTQRNVFLTAEPTRSAIGSLARSLAKEGNAVDWQTLAMLFVADRREHATQIDLALTHGDIVVVDRYALSTIIYQAHQATLAGASGTEAIEWLESLHGLREWHESELDSWLPQPDITLLVRAPVGQEKQLAARVANRASVYSDAFEHEEFLREICGRYWEAEYFDERLLGEVVYINATQEPAEVLNAAVVAVEQALERQRDG